MNFIIESAVDILGFFGIDFSNKPENMSVNNFADRKLLMAIDNYLWRFGKRNRGASIDIEILNIKIGDQVENFKKLNPSYDDDTLARKFVEQFPGNILEDGEFISDDNIRYLTSKIFDNAADHDAINTVKKKVNERYIDNYNNKRKETKEESNNYILSKRDIIKANYAKMTDSSNYNDIKWDNIRKTDVASQINQLPYSGMNHKLNKKIVNKITKHERFTNPVDSINPFESHLEQYMDTNDMMNNMIHENKKHFPYEMSTLSENPRLLPRALRKKPPGRLGMRSHVDLDEEIQHREVPMRMNGYGYGRTANNLYWKK